MVIEIAGVSQSTTLPPDAPTYASSRDAPTRMIFRWPEPDERHPTSTVDGDYALPSEAEVADDELRSWVEAARRSVARWAKENPY